MKDGEYFFQDEVSPTFYFDDYLKFWMIALIPTEVFMVVRAHECRIEPSGALAFYISGDLIDSYAAGAWSGCWRQPLQVDP